MYVCGGGRADGELLKEGRSSKVSSEQKLLDSSWLSLSVNGKYPILLITREQNGLSFTFIWGIVSVIFLGNLNIHQCKWVLWLWLLCCRHDGSLTPKSSTMAGVRALALLCEALLICEEWRKGSPEQIFIEHQPCQMVCQVLGTLVANKTDQVPACMELPLKGGLTDRTKRQVLWRKASGDVIEREKGEGCEATSDCMDQEDFSEEVAL